MALLIHERSTWREWLLLILACVFFFIGCGLLLTSCEPDQKSFPYENQTRR